MAGYVFPNGGGGSAEGGGGGPAIRHCKTIAARDALNPIVAGMKVWVENASDDPDVGTGPAEYERNAANDGWSRTGTGAPSGFTLYGSGEPPTHESVPVGTMFIRI